MKNIPIPPKQHYLKSMMEKVEASSQDKDGKRIFLIKRNVRLAIRTLTLNQILQPHTMNYYYPSKVTYTI